MQKYTFLIHHSEYEGMLDALKALGVLHVQAVEDKLLLETPSEAEQRLKSVESALHLLARRPVPANEAPVAAKPPLDSLTEADVWATQEAWETHLQARQILSKELSAIAPWGEFSWDTLDAIADGGWACSFYTCPVSKFDASWLEDGYTFVINTVEPDVYFVIFHRPTDPPVRDAERLPAPEHSPADLHRQIAELDANIAALEGRLDAMAADTSALVDLQATLLEQIDRADVLYKTTQAADGEVAVLQGFVPRAEQSELEALFDRAGVVYWAESPTPADAPPVLLRNGWFSRLFEPISKLYALPQYGELDLTPFFAPFFMLFFGFCLGDAGYGVVMLLGSLAYRSVARAEQKPLLSLVHFLGLATILFGVLTGTVFGMNLLETEHPALSGIRHWMIDSNQTFNLALILGFIQTLYGLALQAFNRVRQYSWPYGLPPVGWMLLLVSLLDIGLLNLAASLSTYTAWVGVGLIVLFSNPKAGIAGRIGKGLWDLYGITGFFGDLLSYIRLFALGVSSAVLGFVINDIALQIKDFMPIVGPILFVLFLIVGHAANLLIASLGAFVHPMRLTFVEFYKNAGFAGGGKAYQPYSQRFTKTNHL